MGAAFVLMKPVQSHRTKSKKTMLW